MLKYSQLPKLTKKRPKILLRLPTKAKQKKSKSGKIYMYGVLSVGGCVYKVLIVGVLKQRSALIFQISRFGSFFGIIKIWDFDKIQIRGIGICGYFLLRDLGSEFGIEISKVAIVKFGIR